MNSIQKVSDYQINIALLTYNHAAYIQRALDSILSQKTDFPFLIIVGDDGSTDGTQAILKSYAQKFPNQIQLLLAEQNQGVFQNIYKILQACTAPYIALLEGDDYWTYPHKLQTQVDFLNQHPDYQGCFHDTVIEIKDPQKINHYNSDFRYYSQIHRYRKELHPWDLVERTIIPTSSLVFRNRNWADRLLIFRDISLSLSWALECLFIKKAPDQPGKFRYFNEVWSTYNNHPEGLTKRSIPINFKKSTKAILKRLLKDPYYRHLKNHIYYSLLKEELYYFFSASNKKQKRRSIPRFIHFGILYLFYQTKTLIKLSRQ